MNKVTKKFFFTFGQDHYSVDGLAMRDYYVTVISDKFHSAREMFIEKFTSVYMCEDDKWSGQYTEKEFEQQKSYYPNGEYMEIS